MTKIVDREWKAKRINQREIKNRIRKYEEK